MEWHALVSLLTFLFLSFVLPLIIAMVIVFRDLVDDGHAERDMRFRRVILRQHMPAMAEPFLAKEETSCQKTGCKQRRPTPQRQREYQ
ncbi:hypothetical protein [Acetobacter fallax]|uniref:Uncharacterized protein n=1 Tax=Acetobacter fallax TaxID=1737473 RepID=A0ABX0KE06_9PROT|nr:hypothetical protein [Acetobacter fallax]NHO33381.1 hypothetical protein [Acetobacter fallax]NHO37000.1 hypothetical protein [Acetobacter fallax]